MIATELLKRVEQENKAILRAGVASSRRVSNVLRARVVQEFTRGQRIEISDLVKQQLHKLLTNAMIAGHLAGFRRSELVVEEQLSKAKRKGAIALSAMDDALAAYKNKTPLEIDALQAQYGTRALRVLNDVAESTERELRETMNDLLSQGVHAREGIRVLGEKFDKLGLTPKNGFQLETIFRTQTQIAYAAGKWQAEQSPDVQEILWGYKYVTVGDDRVREEHVALEGVTLPKEDPFWLRFSPPNGYNCRCYAIPIFDEREEVAPPEKDEDGEPIEPDEGFGVNWGEAFGNVPEKIDTPEPTDKIEFETPPLPERKPDVVDNDKIESTEPKKPVEFVPHPQASDEETTITVNVLKLNDSWKHSSDYIDSVGTNEIKGRRERFKKFLESDKAVQASRVFLSEQGDVEFIDGRHRFSVFRDAGQETVSITVPIKQAEEFLKRFGI